MINNEVNEITLIYNSEKSDDKKAWGYLQSIRGYKIKSLDLSRESITETQIAELANKMEVAIEDLIDPTFDDHISVHREGLKLMERQEMLTLMKHDPKLISTPILIVGAKAYKFGTGYDLIREGMSREVAGLNHANREEKREE